MRVLALDSAFGGISVAVAEGAIIRSSVRGDPDAKAAESLPRLVQDALETAVLGLADIDRLAVTLGPGGFTSLRAGLAFAKGLAMGAAKPLLGFTTLEALAVSSADRISPVASVIDAKRGEVFLQVFSPRLLPLSEAMTLQLDLLGTVFPWSGSIRACGSGAAFLGERYAGAEIVDVVSPDAAALALYCQDFAPHERPAEAVYLRPAEARPMQ